LLSDTRGKTGKPRDGRSELLVRNLRTIGVVYLVNVSKSSGAGSSGSNQINGHKMVVVVIYRSYVCQ